MPIKDPEKRRETHNRYMREVWYPKNREKHIGYVHRNRVERRKHVRELILSFKVACSFCGETEPICLDFHHVVPTEKELSISDIVSHRNWSDKRIVAEIEKCVVLCSNCHRKVHAGILSLSLDAGKGSPRAVP